ncbi:MAG: hypothetical protein K2Q12_08855 [Rickettsiales bacterium]|nr:hypothetical protein [Rickettsiales bacterium]
MASELKDSISELSPTAKLCIDAANVHHKIIDFTKKELAKIRQADAGRY